MYRKQGLLQHPRNQNSTYKSKCNNCSVETDEQFNVEYAAKQKR